MRCRAPPSGFASHTHSSGTSLYEQLGAARRIRLHGQIGEALVALHERELEPHLAEIAHHFFEAMPGGDSR